MKIKSEYKVGKKFSYVGNSFQRYFYGMEMDSSKAPLYVKRLGKEMSDSEIQKELNPTEITLSELYYALDTVDKNTWYIAYIKDITGVLRAVSVGWGGGGWNVGADALGGPGWWGGGYRVLSRNPFETLSQTLNPSDSLTLEKAIELVKKEGYKIYKEI